MSRIYDPRTTRSTATSRPSRTPASVLSDGNEPRMPAHTPVRRSGEPQGMADAAMFLCAPAAGWISGQILTVSGGGVQDLDRGTSS